MPTTVSPLLPVELVALIEQNITDELDQQNTAQRVREVLLYMVASMGLPATPGGPAPDYNLLLQALAGKADKAAVNASLLTKENKFIPFTQDELRTVEYAYSNLALKPLLRELIRAVVSGGTTTPGIGSETFANDIVVSLANGRTFGKFTSGQTIPAAGKTANEVILLAAIEAILPTYATAGVGVTQSAPADGEVGESVSNTITGTFYQGDAGAVTAMREYRGNQAQIGASSTSSPISRTVQMVRALTPTGIWAVADYAAGPRKNVAPAGTPDTRTPAVRNPNAPQAAETGLSSSIIYFTGYYRLFYGATSAAPGNSAAARALPSSQLTNQGNQGTLLTGTSALRFAIVLPPGRSLQSVTDLDNQGLNLTAKYVAQAPISVADAGGNAVSGYTPYVLSVATPYTSSARHLFTYA